MFTTILWFGGVIFCWISLFSRVGTARLSLRVLVGGGKPFTYPELFAQTSNVTILKTHIYLKIFHDTWQACFSRGPRSVKSYQEKIESRGRKMVGVKNRVKANLTVDHVKPAFSSDTD